MCWVGGGAVGEDMLMRAFVWLHATCKCAVDLCLYSRGPCSAVLQHRCSE